MAAWWAIVLALAAASGASAQDQNREHDRAPQRETPPAAGPLERLGVTGAVRAGYWSSTRTLDAERHLGAGMLWLETTRRVSNRLSVRAAGWTALRGPLDDGELTGELREAFVDLSFGRLDVRAGRQIIAWGRADGLNPTDNLSGQDLTLLVPDDADRRLGATAVRASYYAGDVSFTGVWLPEFRGHAFALPAPPPGIEFVRDADRWPGDQWAVRVEQTGRAVDWSVSYFQGSDLAPDLGIAPDPAGGPRLRLSHHRVRVFGADMAATLGRFGLRAEGAYVRTDDPRGRDPFIKNPFVFVVAGADRTFGGRLNLNAQYLFRYVMDDAAAARTAGAFVSTVAREQAILNSQTRRVQQGISLRIGHTWLHDTLEVECAVAAFADPSGAAVRPKIVYAVTDHWKALLGADVIRGEAASLFGLLRPNSTAYLELRRSF
jgi:hypothetical protein